MRTEASKVHCDDCCYFHVTEQHQRICVYGYGVQPESVEHACAGYHPLREYDVLFDDRK